MNESEDLKHHNIEIFIDEEYTSLVEEDLFVRYAVAALEAEDVPGTTELSVALVSDREVQDLNHQYRGLDEPTDVLSFSWSERVAQEDGPGEAFVSPPDEVKRLGEVVIAYPYAASQAQAAGRPVDKEIAHLIVHGILHILGYDHQEPEAEQVMRAREEAILGWQVVWE